MFVTLYISLVFPIQIHPAIYPELDQPRVSLVRAIIGCLRYIGLPRMKKLDWLMSKAAEMEEGPLLPLEQKNRRK